MLRKLFKSFVELTGNKYVSSSLQTFTKSRLSAPLIRPFINTYKLNESEMEYPSTQYSSIHELFTRKLHAHARPVDERHNVLSSPVDGIISAFGNISADQTFYIKEQIYHVKELLGIKQKVNKYKNGSYFVIYLSPKHYHRIHYPINGHVQTRWALGNTSYPVNSLGEKYGDKPFSTNYRIITETTTEYGDIAIVKVGALNINSIALTNSNTEFKKGDELGYFSFGSTVILLLEEHASFKQIHKAITEVKMGEAIGEWI